MNDTPTPITDAATNGHWRVFDEEGHEVQDPMLVDAEVARKLEQQLAAKDAAIAGLTERLKSAEAERTKLVNMIQTAEREGCIDVSDAETELWRMVESFLGRALDQWIEKCDAKDAAIAGLTERLKSAEAKAHRLRQDQEFAIRAGIETERHWSTVIDERDAIRAERTELQSQLASLAGSHMQQGWVKQVVAEIAALRAENAGLRTLLEDIVKTNGITGVPREAVLEMILHAVQSYRKCQQQKGQP